MTTKDQLAERCARVETAARRALDWVSDPENAETVGLDRKSLAQALRKGASRAQKLGRAARTRMSVSVFGPSQAGKSFLVSVLARPENGRLVADFHGPGGQLDYIREINPEGEGESTGLVTRFTMIKAPCPEGFPIRLVLLSEADVARTIVNSFYMDGDQSEPVPEPEAITAHLDAFRAKAGGTQVPGLSHDDVLEIADYVNRSFGRTAYAAGLRTFWEEAALIAPTLAVADRAAFFAILWGGHEALSDLYIRLGEALQQLGNAEEVHAPLAALTPRESSIIDVKTLHGLYGETGDSLPLCLPSGARVALPRALVCALAAELVMPMQTRPHELFEDTDLLDFPGARNRFEQPLSKTLAEPGKTVTQLLLRGKVAYLFDRYVENQDITSMLLCIPDSNMETLDLPGLVETWIAMTHGAGARQRTASRCILFFVLTKFDKHLGESAAAGGAETRFERRMQASLLEKFGRGKDPWVEHWTPGRPFDNCYWLRNPNFYVEGLIDYDEARREIRIRPDKEARLAELRAGCLEAASVQRHFADPAAAWDAALGLNDGGVSYLIGRLSEICTPDSKTSQIAAQLDRLAADLAADLAPFHVSDDIGRRIEEKREAAAVLIDELEIALQRHRFGAVLAALMVDQDLVQDRISRVPSSIRISQAVSSAATARPAAETSRPTAPARPGRPLRPGRPGRPAPAADLALAEPAATRIATGEPRPDTDTSTHSGTDIRTMTAETFQAESAVEVWIEGLKRFREDVATAGHFGLSPGSVTVLSAELTHALRRIGVVERICAQLKAMAFGLTVDKQAEPAAILCAEHINRFVAVLGSDALPASDRARVELPEGGSRPVFAPRPGADDADGLPPEPRPTAEETWTDWVFALDAMFVANARDSDAGNINVAQNLKLGEILADLGAGGA
ncbi:virulence factor SrfC family protein [Rhodovulum sp. MB263]|uniref:virulence factor SrfC family protein n=1 Tax=Rhodovulum sp. (strain MB263) TaxID=308754 RepID=UPI0009B7A167|nr:virulence factor SrfC family protein [Rhodovulum sp. MB263]ARC88614.1 hypothetical protein B5V46_08295 [Rhodovulum sp. MB263]